VSDPFSAPLERLLAVAASPAVVRQIEAGGSPASLWTSIVESGFLDALVPEAAGGAGLTLADAFALFVVEGRHALPVPLAHTMLVRAALSREGITAPPGAIAVSSQTRCAADGALSCPGTPYGLVVDWVAVERPEGWLLLPAAGAERRGSGIHGSLRANLHWPVRPAACIASQQPAAWQDAGAAVAAAQLAGAMARVLETTVAFANQREQFGRSIGKFQAIQHQLAVMAEQVAAARMAAEIGCSGAGPFPARLRAAVAKARASEAGTLVASIAHAVHGAIGVTAELNLQIYTRRIHEWRADFGSEQHWNRVLGRALLASDAGSALDFMRAELFPGNEEIQR
jgi:acyl-CoA dehydrogenase